MTVLLLAQAGVPLTSGFVAKFGVISAAAGEKSWLLAVLAMVSAVIAAYLYLRIMISMWVADPVAGDDARPPVQVSRPIAAVVAMSVAFTLFVGVLPGPLVGITP
jgi:NADH-quinone oxidoreductase subunit N